MCGIFGYYSFNENKVDRHKFKESLLTIIHRGPDAQICKYYNDDKIGLGHVRLSIIDLSELANQPMQIGKYHLIFNGEIYNYLELREELRDYGYSFQTDSDTEVLINAYAQWDEACVKRFNGMWAFSILNTEDNSLFCSRDRFGVKPFNYYYDKSKFIFSSEIKPIIAYDNSLINPNFNSISLFCREGICGELEETWFKNILRLKPGHNLVVKNGVIEIRQYYDYPNNIVKKSWKDAKNEFYELFIDSIKLRMRSDVPVGTSLSGGLDSSSIIAGLRTFNSQMHNTFTAHFPNFVEDELEIANKTNQLFSLTGNPIKIEYKENYFEILEKLIYHLESGHLSPSIVPIWSIFENAKPKIKVMLEGQGSDELLGGYVTTFAGSYIIEKIIKFQIKDALKTIWELFKKNLLLESGVLYLRFIMPSFLKTFSRRYILNYENIFIGKLKDFKYPASIKAKSDSSFKQHLQKAHQNTLVSLLHYGDAISMAYSIETRLPFLDYRLVDFAMNLEDNYLFYGGNGKIILRESLKKIIPEYIYNSKSKLGFPTPVGDFFNFSGSEIKNILLSEKALSRGLFDRHELTNLIDSNLNNMRSSNRVIFRLICVELWFRNFIDLKIV